MQIITGGKTLKPQQVRAYEQCLQKLTTKKFCLLWGDTRSGKTLIAACLIKELLSNGGRALFITSKSALTGVQKHFKTDGITELVDVVNFEMAHKATYDYSFVIIDESHRIGGYPKPAQIQKVCKKLCFKSTVRTLLMSGTPFTEARAKMFHQLNISPHAPFGHFKNFYQFVREGHIFTSNKRFGLKIVPDYRNMNPATFKRAYNEVVVRLTEADVDITRENIVEEVIEVETPAIVLKAMKDLLFKGTTVINGVTIEAPQRVQVLSKFHQLCSGTVKGGKQNDIGVIVDDFKVNTLKEATKGMKRFAVFVKYILEKTQILEAIEGGTSDVKEFLTNPNIRYLVTSFTAGSTGVDLSDCEAMFLYTIDHSADNHVQTMARLVKQGVEDDKKVIKIFSDTGLENEIFQRVSKKMDFDTQEFINAIKFNRLRL